MTSRVLKRTLSIAESAGYFVMQVARAPKLDSSPNPARAAARRVAGAVDTGFMVGVSIDRVLGKELADGHKSS